MPQLNALTPPRVQTSVFFFVSQPYIIEDYEVSMKSLISVGEDICQAVEDMKTEACSIPYFNNTKQKQEEKPSVEEDETLIKKLNVRNFSLY